MHNFEAHGIKIFILFHFLTCMVQAFKNVLDKFVGVNLESWKLGVRRNAKSSKLHGWIGLTGTSKEWIDAYLKLELFFVWVCRCQMKWNLMDELAPQVPPKIKLMHIGDWSCSSSVPVLLFVSLQFRRRLSLIWTVFRAVYTSNISCILLCD